MNPHISGGLRFLKIMIALITRFNLGFYLHLNNDLQTYIEHITYCKHRNSNVSGFIWIHFIMPL